MSKFVHINDLNDINSELSKIVDELYNLCFLISYEKSNKNINELLLLINCIFKYFTNDEIKNLGPQKLLPCLIKILFKCDKKLYETNKILRWYYKRYFNESMYYYKNILNIFINENIKEMINIIIRTVHQEKYWQWEDFCYKLFYILFDIESEIRTIFIYNLMNNAVLEKTTSITDSKLMLRCLYNILNNYTWDNSKETLLIIERLLEFYYNGVMNCYPKNIKFKSLKKTFEVCLRSIINHLPNDCILTIISRICCWINDNKLSEATILKFGNVLEYAAHEHKTKLLEDILINELFFLLMKMIASSNQLISLLGNRILQRLIDRQNNRKIFERPQIFLNNLNYNINITECNKKDKEFLKQHRELIHNTFMTSLIKHCSIRLNLESTYCSICLIAVEVPSGFTAAALVCLIMNIQDSTLEQEEMDQEISYRIHAIVMATLSLLCWIHCAQVLYSYVNKIMMERAQWAPHLNPPIKSYYTFAFHHVRWNKSDLFFVDWEARFGLWKCFRQQLDTDIQELCRLSSYNKL